HERPVQLTVGVRQIPEGGRAGVGQVGAAADREDDAVVKDSGIDVELRRPMATRAAGSALVDRAEEDLFPVILAGGEIRKRLRVRHGGSPAVVFGVEGLDAANELSEGVLDSRLVDGGRAKSEVEEDRIFRNGGEF